MRERAIAHIWLAIIEFHITDFRDKPRHFGQFFQLDAGDAIDPHLKLQGSYDRYQVSITASFAISIDGAMNLYAARLYRSNGIGHSHIAVIVRVDTER